MAKTLLPLPWDPLAPHVEKKQQYSYIFNHVKLRAPVLSQTFLERNTRGAKRFFLSSSLFFATEGRIQEGGELFDPRGFLSCVPIRLRLNKNRSAINHLKLAFVACCATQRDPSSYKLEFLYFRVDGKIPSNFVATVPSFHHTLSC